MHKIILLDDDHYPEGRVSKYILPEFKKLSIGKNVIHYKTFAELKKDILARKVERDSLFVMDSSLEEEPDRHLMDFTKTIPIMLGTLGIKHKNIIPASGGSNGYQNNGFFFDYLARIEKVEDWGQRCLEISGFTGKPSEVVQSIIEYHQVLYPDEIKNELTKEVSIPSQETVQEMRR